MQKIICDKSSNKTEAFTLEGAFACPKDLNIENFWIFQFISCKNNYMYKKQKDQRKIY